MRLIVNGIENGENQYLYGSDATLTLLFCEDDGTPLTLIAPVVASVEMYPSSSRAAVAIGSLTLTIGADGLGGICTAVIQDTATLPPRGTVYLSGVWKSGPGTGIGTLVKISSGFDTLTVI